MIKKDLTTTKDYMKMKIASFNSFMTSISYVSEVLMSKLSNKTKKLVFCCYFIIFNQLYKKTYHHKSIKSRIS